MSDLDVLRELIEKKASVSLANTPYGKKAVTLKEAASPGNSPYSVKINGIPKDAIVIKTDMFPAPDRIFMCRKGECRRADYVIITNSDQGNFILYIEMKKGTDKLRKIIEQLKGAQCFIAYCREIGRVFWQQPGFLGANYQSRFVTIREIRINKRPTINRPQSSLNDNPEDVLKIKGKGNLRFRELVLRKRK